MMLHKTAANVARSDEERQAIEQYHREMIRAGVMRAREGLQPSSTAVRVTFSGRNPTVANGSAAAADIDGFIVIDVKSKDEAIEWAKRWPVTDVRGDIEIEIREGGCPGGVPTVSRSRSTGSSPSKPTRYIVLLKADTHSEAGILPDERRLAAMTKRNEESVAAGVMIAGEGLQPSVRGARVKFSGGKPAVIDGPFAEAKELVAGYWMLEVNSKEEALEWVRTYPFPFDDAEIEVREALDFEPVDPPSLV